MGKSSSTELCVLVIAYGIGAIVLNFLVLMFNTLNSSSNPTGWTNVIAAAAFWPCIIGAVAGLCGCVVGGLVLLAHEEWGQFLVGIGICGMILMSVALLVLIWAVNGWQSALVSSVAAVGTTVCGLALFNKLM